MIVTNKDIKCIKEFSNLKSTPYKMRIRKKYINKYVVQSRPSKPDRQFIMKKVEDQNPKAPHPFILLLLRVI